LKKKTKSKISSIEDNTGRKEINEERIIIDESNNNESIDEEKNEEMNE
jgi:hypothetical protein